MKRVRLWAAVAAVMLLCAGCKDFFHPEGPTKPDPGRYFVTDAEAAKIFKESEAVKEALELEAAEIGLGFTKEELAALEAQVDEALAAYVKLPQGAKTALAGEKAKLDGVKQKIGHVYSAQQFQGSHTAVLAKQPENIDTPAKAADLLPGLEKALEEYEALDEPVKELLKGHSVLLGSLKAKADEIIDASKPVAVTIIFDSHGGSEVPAIEGNMGTKINEPDEPTRDDGYTFTGWFDAATGGVLYPWPYTLAGDLTMHAQWRDDTLPPPVRHTITFDSHDGSEVSSITADTGTPVSKPADPQRAGYRFLGWFNAASEGTKYDWPHALTADVTIHAQWIQQHTITFETNGGSPVPKAVTADTGTPVSKPADPTRTGYGFDGWFSAASGGTEYTAWPHTLTGDITMHTQWTAIAYTVQYNANGGGGTMTPSAHTYDTAKGLTDNGFVRSGYSFKEWAAAPNGSGAVYPNGGSVVNLSSADGAAVDLYAQWTAIEYSIDYKLDGGKNDDANPATYTIETAIPLAAPKRDGYDFGGWYDNSGFTGSAVTGIPAGSTEAKTFYARWDPLAPIETTLLQPAADPVLTAKVVFVGDTDTFTAVGGYTNHEWYWDGVLQSGQTGPTYTLTGEEEAGIYELSVVVTGEGGKPLSARCKVTIKAKN